MSRTLATAAAFIDSSDSASVGWAYRLTFTDGHEESGALDSAIEDGGGAVCELQALIAGIIGGDIGVGPGGIECREGVDYLYRAA